jgi:RNA polymerase sigma factor (sigma-70 family)
MIFENATISKGRSETAPVVVEFHERAEAWLVEAAKMGHSTAFATLSERYKQQLLRAAHRITKSPEDAEDAVQDALLMGYIHLSDFNGASSFGTWLTRIAINSALMILRKKRTSLEVAMDGSDESGRGSFSFQIPDRAPNPERRYAQSEERIILKKAIDKLRPRLRQVVCIQQLQEHSMQETAQVIGISVAAAKARLLHAKAALRKSSILQLARRTRKGRPIPILSAA